MKVRFYKITTTNGHLTKDWSVLKKLYEKIW
jgi:hypothetical protein